MIRATTIYFNVLWLVLMAEFHAIVLGLVMAVEIGVPRIVIENDFKFTIELIPFF